MNGILTASASPHKRNGQTTKSIMIDVLIALAPAAIAGIVYFGWKAALVLLLSTLSAVLTEVVWLLIVKTPFRKILKNFDFTSAVTGLLLGMCLNSEAPWYVPVLSSIFAIGAVKMFFGGTGKNFVNPALTGRVFAFIAFQAVVTSGYVLPNFSPEGMIATGATPLADILNPTLSNFQLFMGIGVAGCIGETCKLALVIGFIYLVVRKVLDWKWPVLTVIACGLTSVILYGFNFAVFMPAILSGGLLLGAIFMATDYVTSPKTQLASIFYFLILGVLIAVMRKATEIEVVSFMILFMNLFVPLFDRFIRPKPFGQKEADALKKAQEAKN